MSERLSASGRDKAAQVIFHRCQPPASSCSSQQADHSTAAPSASFSCAHESSSISSADSSSREAPSRPLQTSWAGLFTASSSSMSQPPRACPRPAAGCSSTLKKDPGSPAGPMSDSLPSIAPTKIAVSSNSWASLLGGSNLSQETGVIAKPTDDHRNHDVTSSSGNTPGANGMRRGHPSSGPSGKNTKLKVEITFRPDRELKQPEGCEWLERRIEMIDLSWDWMYLKTFLEDTVRRHLSEREQQAWARLPATKGPVSRAETTRVWGIRAVGVDVPQRDGRKDVQLYDREQKWKVDMSWEDFLQRLPAHKRVNVGEKPAWTLYLAYDMGVSLHRDLRGKPKALLS